ncbi:MAG TPA: hypothetical protein VEJ63_18680 [Planctomycetota bacterium]|nr:hypothetical protein [Planctomycetota bacterium]
MPGQRSYFDYVKAAFRNRWNLLLLGAGGAFAFLSPWPDAVLAGLAGLELGLITYVATLPRFQRAIDSTSGAAHDPNQAQRFQQLYNGLDAASRARFDQLRSRCEVIRDPGSAVHDNGDFHRLSSMQVESVNRLLWVYLKLLHSKLQIHRFLERSSEQTLSNDINSAKERLEKLPDSGDELTEKKRRSLEDTLKTAKARFDNYKRAKSNYEYIELELERIGSKVTALSEMAVNRMDPSLLTNEVDHAAESVHAAEQTISELADITGISAADTSVPEILQRQPAATRVRG